MYRAMACFFLAACLAICVGCNRNECCYEESSGGTPTMMSAEPAGPNMLTSAERAAGWKLLFDGQTANGWRGYKMDKMPPGWDVENGALVRFKGGAGGKGAGGGDDIVTTRDYANFDLMLEWKLVKGGNSGVLYHVSEEPVTSWNYAPEMQVLDNTIWPNRSKKELAGACYDLYAPSKDVTKPVGEWNQARLLVNGTHAEHWLNGEKLCEYELWSNDWNERVSKSKFKGFAKFGTFKTGPICLQDHSDRIEFRNIKIKDLSAPQNMSAVNLLTTGHPPMPPRLGEFDGERDIGKVDPPGMATIDRATGKYTIKSGGANIWFKQDDFHFASKKASGDIVMSAEIEFAGAGKNPHRKAGLMIRQDLDADSAYVDAVQHGDGTIALQYRKAKGDDTAELKSHVKAPASVRIERHGTTNTVYVTPKGGKTEIVTPIEIELKDPVYIGLVVSAHDPATAETAVFSNVKVTSGEKK